MAWAPSAGPTIHAPPVTIMKPLVLSLTCVCLDQLRV